MSVPRVFHTATLLQNGKVLVAGGLQCVCLAPTSEQCASGIEVYDPATQTTGCLATSCPTCQLASGEVL
jgi:hypothetical protein